MDNKIVEKVQKLLNLAGNNPNENEAKAALLKAQKLMAEYNISMSGLAEEPGARYELVTTKVTSRTIRNKLANVIGDSFACKVIIIGGKLSFFGYSMNAKAAASAFEFAYKSMERGGRKACKEVGLDASASGGSQVYNSYFSGFVCGIKEALDAQSVALAIVIQQDVKEEFSNRFSNSKLFKSQRVVGGSQQAFSSGKVDGNSCMGKRELKM